MHDDFHDRIAENLNKIDIYKHNVRAMTKEEILKRYNDGERDFSNIVAPNIDISGANLSDIILRRAKLGHSSFKNCNLRGADFSFAEAQDSNFENADMAGANFSNAVAFNSTFK